MARDCDRDDGSGTFIENILAENDYRVFRPVTGLKYALTLGGADPVHGAPPIVSMPEGPAVWQDAVARLGNAPATTVQAIQTGLNKVREQVISLAKQFRSSGDRGEDISVDLLSVGSGITVVMTDSRTEARAKAGKARSPVGVSFEWGLGVAGRALRLMKNLTWSRDRHTGHVSTWPARDWYYRVEQLGPHAHIYSAPLVYEENGQLYAFAMLSFATNRHDSLLLEVVKRLRTPTTAAAVAADCERMIGEFTETLGKELASYAQEDGGADAISARR